MPENGQNRRAAFGHKRPSPNLSALPGPKPLLLIAPLLVGTSSSVLMKRPKRRIGSAPICPRWKIRPVKSVENAKRQLDRLVCTEFDPFGTDA